MKYSIVICLTILLTSPAVFSAGSEEKEPEGTDRLAEADRLFNQGLQHRDRAWEYEKQAEGALKPKDRDVYLKSAEREFKRALKAFKSATKQNSRHYEAFGSLGYAQRKVGKFKDALKSYDRALKMKPDYPEALEYRAEAYLGLNRIDDAKIDYEKLVKLDQDNARTFLDAASKWLLITITPRKRLGSLVYLSLLCCQLLGAGVVSGQLAVVVNQGNGIEGVTLQSLRDIYAGNKVSWRNNHKIFPVSMKSNLAITRSFFEKALDKSPREMIRAWIRLSLSGAGVPPKVVGSEAEVLLYVAKNEGAIGFVGIDKVNESVKVLAVQGKLPSDKGYLLKSVQ